MTSFYLEHRHPEKNIYRYYKVAIVQTLFGEWALVREWGRIGQGGTVRESWFDSEEEAVAASLKLRESKEKKGYREVAGAAQ